MQSLSQYFLVDNNDVLCYGSQVIMVSAAAMKKQVAALREEVLLN